MKDVECPYCGEWQEINHDDGYGYEEDTTYEQECSDCEMTFAYTTGILFVYDTHKAPCMNGGEHEWEPRASSHYPNMKGCKNCDEVERGELVMPT